MDNTGMDFFTHQENARRKTGTLLFYLVMAILGITLSVYAVIRVMLGQFVSQTDGQIIQPQPILIPELILGVAVSTLLLVTLGAVYKLIALRSGGKVIATSLGGKLISSETRDPDERKVLNIVEEMSIASGLPVPPVYLLPQPISINAFAAGYRPETAVVGVTQGTIRALNRDELQGVMAHEFSHILNGDMRMNIRLVGVLHGILLIALLGYQMMRITARATSDSDSAKAGAPILILGLCLVIIGQVGVFFGHLIKSAVSRQREYLADASAVQFTRFPPGLAGALKKIGGLQRGSFINHPKAEEASHMYFSHGLKRRAAGAMATHPPLKKRVKQLIPTFDGKFEKLYPDILFAPPSEKTRKAAKAADEKDLLDHMPPIFKDMPIPGSAQPVILGTILAGDDSAPALNSIGNPAPEHIAKARELLDAMPPELKHQAHSAEGAQALIYGQLLRHSAEQRADMLNFLQKHTPQETFSRIQDVEQQLATIPTGLFLPLAELAVSGLRNLEVGEYHQFRRRVQVLVELDQSVTLFEFALGNVLFRTLDVYFDGEDRKPFAYYSLSAILPQASTLLSAMARLGQSDDEAAHAAFQSAQQQGPKDSKNLTWLPPEKTTLRDIQRSLDDMNILAYPVRRHILKMCLHCLTHDKIITEHEAELFRAIAASLGCPVPVWVVGETAG